MLIMPRTERQKATRLAKKLKRQLAEAEDPEEIAKIKADLRIAEVDLDYAVYHPFLEPYTSMYTGPTGESKDDDKSTAAQLLHAPRPPMWYTIEKVREGGKEALEKLQNRQAEKLGAKQALRALKNPVSGKTQPSKVRQEQQQGAETPHPAKSVGKSVSLQNGTNTGPKNRRERRKAQFEAEAAAKQAADDSGSEGGFFEELV